MTSDLQRIRFTHYATVVLKTGRRSQVWLTPQKSSRPLLPTWASTSQTEECRTNVSMQRYSQLGNGQKAQVEVKTSTEALQRQHGEPVRMLPEDWTSVIVKFKSKYGSNLQEEELPAQAYFEEFQEKLAAGMLQAEPLDQVISQAEAEEQDRKKPDPPRQYGMHLNATLTIQTRRRYIAALYQRILRNFDRSMTSCRTAGSWVSNVSRAEHYILTWIRTPSRAS